MPIKKMSGYAATGAGDPRRVAEGLAMFHVPGPDEARRPKGRRAFVGVQGTWLVPGGWSVGDRGGADVPDLRKTIAASGKEGSEGGILLGLLQRSDFHRLGRVRSMSGALIPYHFF
jgi:hypothetical protein